MLVSYFTAYCAYVLTTESINGKYARLKHDSRSGGCGVIFRAQLGLTIEEVPLGFQDLNDIIDPSPADLRRGGLQLEAHHTPIWVA